MSDSPLAGAESVLQTRTFLNLNQKIRMSSPKIELTDDLKDLGQSSAEDLIDVLISEETTDYILDLAADRAPWGSGWLIRRALDPILPDELRAVFRLLLSRAFDDGA